MRRSFVIPALLLTFFVAPSRSFAQGNTQVEIAREQHVRRCEGFVRDPLGSPIKGADIELRNPRTGEVANKKKSAADGHFAVDVVVPGRYDLKAFAPGFDLTIYHVKLDNHGSKHPLIVTLQVAN